MDYPGNIFFFSTSSPQQNCKLLESKGHVFLYCVLGQYSVQLNKYKVLIKYWLDEPVEMMRKNAYTFEV